jgi:hypothetical protein
MDTQNVYDYIKGAENAWKIDRVPLTRNKTWNMAEHIERCTAVSSGFFYEGKDDGNRPYDDIVTPIVDVAFRSEGFDVKDIVPFVDDATQSFKSFLVKKFHPAWARKNQLDTFIDEVVESSIVYDLVLVKDVQDTRPEVVDLKTIAFCDQTNIMAGPICIRHQMTPAEIVEMKGKWDDDMIDRAIVMSLSEVKVSTANDQVAKTPGKYIEVYELRGPLPETWLDKTAPLFSYTPQAWYVTYYTTTDGERNGIPLYSGPDKPLSENFFALKIDGVRSKGRACGRSIVERMFQPQVWNNYSGIKIKKMLDSAFNLIISDSEELGDKKLTDLKLNTILKQEKGATTTRFNSDLNNLTGFQNYQNGQKESARLLGNASEGSLGINPSSGTPFALQDLIVNEGQGMHQYRQGKIATFFADVLYPKLILPYLVDEMDEGKKFSEELSLDELAEIATTISDNIVEGKISEQIMKTGIVPTDEEREVMKQAFKDDIMNGKTPMYSNGRGFFEILKGEIKSIPMKVFVNVAGKQKYLARDADKLSKIFQMLIANPQAFQMIPGLGSAFNQIVESAGLNPINFSKIIKGMEKLGQPVETKQTPSVVGEAEVVEEQKNTLKANNQNI